MKKYKGLYSPGLYDWAAYIDNGNGWVPLLNKEMRSGAEAINRPALFCWGYLGSGPKDLARSILWEHFDKEPDQRECQIFAETVVANWNYYGDWELNAQAIELWHTELKGNK